MFHVYYKIILDIFYVSFLLGLSIVFIDMKHDWEKSTLIPTVAAQDRDATNLTRYFYGVGSPSSQGGSTPKFKYCGNYFYMN